jgi:hypothetical protein
MRKYSGIKYVLSNKITAKNPVLPHYMGKMEHYGTNVEVN